MKTNSNTLTPRKFRQYVLDVVEHITKTRRKVDIHFDSQKETRPYYVIALRLSKNKTYWLVGSRICPPEDPPAKLKTLVRSRHALKGWKESTLIGYTVCAPIDLPPADEMASMIIREHKRSLSRKSCEMKFKRVSAISPGMSKTLELFTRPKS